MESKYHTKATTIYGMIPSKLTQQAVHFRISKGNTLLFFLIKKDNEIFHLTFNKTKHQKAIRFLRSMSGRITEAPDRIMVLGQINDMLTTPRPLEKYSSSPFIKQGSSFQQQVWEHISRIPFGTTQTYGELATKIGNKNLARAVGQACNVNPLSLLIPCHRVVGINGIGGYAGGTDIKKKLLEFESGNIFKPYPEFAG